MLRVDFMTLELGDVIFLLNGEKWRVSAIDPNREYDGQDHLSGGVTLEEIGEAIDRTDRRLIIAWNYLASLGPLGIWDWEERCFLPEFNHPEVIVLDSKEERQGSLLLV